MIRTANPALGPKTFTAFPQTAASNSMTIAGTVTRTAVLLGLLLISAAMTWQTSFKSGVAATMPLLWGGMIGGMVMALVTILKKPWAMFTGSLYALAEGLVIGALSAMFEQKYPGIVINAAALTFGTLFSLLLAYRSGLIRATENFKLGVFAATGGIMLVYFVTFLLGIFGVSVPYIHGNGLIGIGVSVFVVIIAALNLVLDFDFIEEGAARGAPKYMEWYAAFGLMVTLVWLYIEILRLLAKLRSRR